MGHEFFRHRRAYALLAVALVAFTLLFFAAWPNQALQRVVILAMSLFYVTWGCLTHLHTQRLTKQVAYEYASVALLAGTLLMLITL